MEETTHKKFNLAVRKNGWRLNRPKVCQFELTFKCGLHCSYCYVDCYNSPAHTKEELDTQQVKSILDKIYDAGVLWLYLTGGDPLTRPDFLEIYSYAKEKGFIVVLFTNAYSMTKEVAGYLSRKPPAKIEITLNAVSKALYEKISQVKGSFARTIRGIEVIMEAKLPLKIKTQVIRDNLEETDSIKRFVKKLGLDFWPFFGISPRLNGDFSSRDSRISPDEALRVPEIKSLLKKEISRSRVFSCQCLLEKKDCIYLDPYGNTFSCVVVREPSFNLLKVDVEYAQNRLSSLVRNRKSAAGKNHDFCAGMAYLEKSNTKGSDPYYYELAKVIKRETHEK